MGIELEEIEAQNKSSKTLKTINIVLVVIIAILALILISMSFLWTPMTVKGESMEDTFFNDDRIILQTAWYKYTYGDIIVFSKIEEEKNVIKRVIGLPGDYIRFNETEGAYYRNGEKLIESYVKGEYLKTYMNPGTKAEEMVRKALCSEQGYYVEEGKVFVLGDNRNCSLDSHKYGAIDTTQIRGKFLFGY